MLSADARERLVTGFRQLNDFLGAGVLPPSMFVDVCRDLAKFVALCGPALQFAAYDVQTKLGTLESRLGTKYVRSLFDVITDELRNGTIDSTSTHSVGRCVQRMTWFLDYAKTLIHHLTQKTSADMELSQCARAAYEECLAENHTWLTRQAVRLALHACPDRRTFYHAVSTDMAITFDFLKSIHDVLAVTTAYLYDFYAQKEIGRLQ